MGVERTVVQVKVDEREALASGRRVRGELDKIEAEAKETQRAVDQARTSGQGLQGRFAGLLDRAKRKGILKEEGLEFGPFAVGRSGFRMSEEYTKGKKGGMAGPLLRGAFIAGVTGNAIGAGLGTIADFRQYIDEFDMTPAQALKEVSREMSRGIFDRSGAAAIVRNGLRLAGERVDVIDAAFDLAFGSSEPTALEAEIDAQKANRRAFMKWQAERDKAERKAERKREEAIDNALAKIDQQLAERLKGLRAPQLPIRVSEEMFRDMQWQQAERERLRAKILRKRISEGAGN